MDGPGVAGLGALVLESKRGSVEALKLSARGTSCCGRNRVIYRITVQDGLQEATSCLKMNRKEKAVKARWIGGEVLPQSHLVRGIPVFAKQTPHRQQSQLRQGDN